MSFAPNDIVFILGAGASIPAGIHGANSMITELEKAFDESNKRSSIYNEFKNFKNLYYQIKSSIIYAQGLRGIFENNNDYEYHIETLVKATHEIERYLEHPLYPFIANWNQRFFEQAGNDFCHVKDFSKRLLKQLRNWIMPSDYKRKAESYYHGFTRLSRDIIQFELRVFSLNYDLCFEAIEDDNFIVEQGFDLDGYWNWRRMQSDVADRENQEKAKCGAYLYKMHGSIDWTREEDGRLKRVAKPEEVDPSDIQIIFGREDKMTVASSDPFIYYISQFRAALHSAKLIVAIGYSFSDEHINKTITAALRDKETNTRCLSVTYAKDKEDAINHKTYVSKKLKVDGSLLSVYEHGADIFLNELKLEEILQNAMPQEASVPF